MFPTYLQVTTKLGNLTLFILDMSKNRHFSANIEDQDELPYEVVSHQGLQCLL